jgi:AcrR family transcriptional regulator
MSRTELAIKSTASAPRSRKGALTRARLLEAAKSVFEEAGFLEARVSDIAGGAGLSQGSFYHYFDSKEQIFRELAEEHEAMLIAPDADEEREATSVGISDLARIRRGIRRYLERYRDNSRIMRVIEEVSRYDSFVNLARRRRQEYFADRAARAIRTMQERGTADPEVDPEVAALALGAMLRRFAELWLVEGWKPFDFDEMVDQLTLLWVNAIGLRGMPDHHRSDRGEES